jgi:NitT/TauT family transport system ATP-binding protein
MTAAATVGLTAGSTAAMTPGPTGALPADDATDLIDRSGELAEPKLIVDGVGKVFQRRKATTVALAAVDMYVEDGELVCLLGPSGCGKSTLLSIIGGLQTATTGEVRVERDVVIGPGADRGMVFQGFSLFPWLNVARNIDFGLDLAGWSKEQRRDRVDELLGIMSLREFANALPSELSGGMRQRVAIARALAPEPDLLLLDEPFGSLDALTKQVLQDFLITVWRRTRSTILMVTHDVEEAIYLSSRIYVMAARPGRIAEEIEVPFGEDRGPLVKRDRRFLDLRDELSQLLG